MYEFTYLGAIITEVDENKIEIKARLSAFNRCYYSFQKLFNSRLKSKEITQIIYETLIRPVIIYSSEVIITGSL